MRKRKWEACETSKKVEYESRGCKVIRTGRGSDFVAVCPDKPLTFVEVKKGCGSLSKLQRKTRKQVEKNGLQYKVERCGCKRKSKK